MRKELEQTTKNCRVLSFKLKKTERKSEQLDQEKKDQEKKLLEVFKDFFQITLSYENVTRIENNFIYNQLAGGPAGMDRLSKIKQLEQELAMSNEVALRLQRELQEANNKLSQQPAITQKKAPSIGLIGKSQSTDAVCIFLKSY